MSYNTIRVSYTEKPVGNDLAYELTWVGKGTEWKDFKELLKALIPASNRVYNPQTKLWTIDSTGFASLKKIMDTLHIYYYKVDSFSSKESKNSKVYDSSDFFHNPAPALAVETKESLAERLTKILDLAIEIKHISPDELKKFYRRKALEYHPDRNGGDGSKMSELNSIWSAYNAS